MLISAGLLSLALAGFVDLAAAQPHGNLKRHDEHHHLMRRGNSYKTEMVTSYVTVTGVSYGSVPSPTAISLSPTAIPPPTGNYVNSKDKDDKKDKGDQSGGDSSSDSTVESNSDTDKEYPDGKYDCDTFPKGYGPIPLPWVTKDSWSGIQVGNGNGDAAGKCVEGALCSYACPPGYSKSQWPEDQPASGESHGGLLCKGGKLHLTRPSYPKLCQAGQGGVTVHNIMKGFVSICRTDYPGTENMVVPLSCPAGSTTELTVPNSDVSYVWQGKSTSAQYYVNPAGTSVKDGCTWGKEGGGMGNWSPMVFGAGAKDGTMWLSISQNQLNSKALGYNVAIIGGNNICKYEDGKFISPGGTPEGCTTAVKCGQKAKYVLYSLGSAQSEDN